MNYSEFIFCKFTYNKEYLYIYTWKIWLYKVETQKLQFGYEVQKQKLQVASQHPTRNNVAPAAADDDDNDVTTKACRVRKLFGGLCTIHNPQIWPPYLNHKILVL